MNEAMIFEALRTPRGKGKADGSLHEVKPVALLSGLLNTLKERTDLDTAAVDDVVMGCVTPIGDQGGCIAKTAALAAGWDWSASGVQLNRFCASGLEAVNQAAQRVRSGWDDLIVAGGVESMSRVPIGADGGPWALDPETSLATNFVPQGIGADLIATIDGYSRDDVDAYAVESQRRAAAARDAGRFADSVVPVVDRNGLPVLEQDEFIKPQTTMQGLGTLSPSFEQAGRAGFDSVALRVYPQLERIEHVHTAGNSSGIVDGAAAVLVGSEARGRALGLSPRGRVVACALAGSDPTIMLTGPVPATRKALARAGMRIEDIDLFEVNEAFAVVTEKYIRDLAIDRDKINVNGGAIALGHPIGATGSMLIGTVLDELERQDKQFGLVTMCAAGGMAPAIIIERI